MGGRELRYEILLLTTKNHNSCPIVDNGISSFRYSYINNGDSLHDQHYLSESSSPSHTDPNYIQNQGTNLDTTIEIKEPSSQSSLSKGFLS